MSCDGHTAFRTLTRVHLRPIRKSLAIELSLLALILIGATVVFARGLHSATNYDEGNYLASVDALRHGQSLGRDVFLDQPPGWYLLLQGLAATLGNNVVSIRSGLLVIALIGLVSAWAAGRALGGPTSGLLAAAMLAIAAPYPSLAGTVEADPPSTVLALTAIVFTLYSTRRTWLLVVAGATLALAVSVKLFAVTAAVPIAIFVIRRRQARDLGWVAAGFCAIVLAFAVGYHSVLHEVWSGAVGAHIHARQGHQPNGVSNLSRVVHLPDLRTPFGWLALIGLVVAVASLIRRRPLGIWPLWLFTAAAVGFTLTMSPLLDHHLVLLATALAVPAAAALGMTLRGLSPVFVVVVSLCICAGLFQEHRRLARNDAPERPSYQWAARVVAANTGPDQLVVSDIPSIPYLADRREPGQLIDTSIGRIIDEYLQPAEVLRLVDEAHAPVVVAGRNFLSKRVIMRGLSRRYPRRVTNDHVTVFLRPR